MKSLRIVGIALVTVLVVLVVVGALLPAQWKVQRAIVVQAPPAAIYPLVANLKSGWPQWSAFDSEDPAIQYTTSGPAEGVGAARSWVSKKMGDGSQKILKADPAGGVEFELEMANGFRMTGTLVFERSGAGTKVTWTDSGDVGANPLYRYLAAVMDPMLGGTFERSLARLKAQAEAAQPR